MEESQEILLKSLENSGVCVPSNVSSIRDLKPDSLVSICGQALNLIDNTDLFPISLPDSSVADQFKICADIGAGIENLGYHGDMSFLQVRSTLVTLIFFDFWLLVNWVDVWLPLKSRKVQ